MVFVRPTRILCALLLLIFGIACDQKNLEVDDQGSGGEVITVGITFDDPVIALTTLNIPLDIRNAFNISLGESDITLNSTDGIECQVSVTSGTSTSPVISLSGCAGAGEFTLTIAEGVAQTTDGRDNVEITSQTFSYDSTRPTLSLSEPTITGSNYVFDVNYSGAETINLTAAYVGLIVGGNTTCDDAAVVNGTGPTPQIQINNCIGTGTITVSISFGSSRNAYGISDNGLFNDPITVSAIPGDFNDSMVFAYSLRKVHPDYTGNLVDVRKDGGTTVAIGFDSETGELDTAALTAHLGGSTGFVTKWYDQSGNGYDAINTTDSLQPEIRLNSTNSRYGVYFPADADDLQGLETAVTVADIQTDMGNTFGEVDSGISVFIAHHPPNETQDRLIFNNYNAATCATPFDVSGGNTCELFGVTRVLPLAGYANQWARYAALLDASDDPIYNANLQYVAAVFDPSPTVDFATCDFELATGGEATCKTAVQDDVGATSMDSGKAFVIGRLGIDSAASSVSANHYKGYIHELIIYDEAVSDFDRIRAELTNWNP